MLRILISYAYVKSVNLSILDPVKDDLHLLLDCGAFTEHKKGKKMIDFDAYCNYALEFSERFDCRYFALDVIGDRKLTMLNYKKMLKMGMKPLPVWTTGSTQEDMDLFKSQSDLVAIGGTDHRQVSETKAHLQRAMKVADGHPVHWLGYANLPMVRKFRPAQLDTSTWNNAEKFNNLPVFAGGILKVQPAKTIGAAKLIGLCDRVGVDASELLMPDGRCARVPAQQFSIRSYLMFADLMERRIGTKYYFACTSSSQVQAWVDAYEWFKNK